MIGLLDCQGNPVQLRRLYEDRKCLIYSDWCFVWDCSEPNGTISFAYDNGRIKTFSLVDASQFTRGLRMLGEEAQGNFDSIRSRVEGLVKMVA
jgi:hypothetical protein